jgi:hypothetical protein
MPWAAGTRAAAMAELWPWGATVEPRAPAVPRLGWVWGMLRERWWCSLAVFLGGLWPWHRRPPWPSLDSSPAAAFLVGERIWGGG